MAYNHAVVYDCHSIRILHVTGLTSARKFFVYLRGPLVLIYMVASNTTWNFYYVHLLRFFHQPRAYIYVWCDVQERSMVAWVDLMLAIRMGIKCTKIHFCTWNRNLTSRNIPAIWYIKWQAGYEILSTFSNVFWNDKNVDSSFAVVHRCLFITTLLYNWYKNVEQFPKRLHVPT